MHIRKNIRLKNFDYSQNAIYHITVCTSNKTNILCDIHKNENNIAYAELSEIGCIINEAIKNIESHYSNVFVINYVIMPDHLHLLIQIDNDPEPKNTATTISNIIMQFKRFVSIKVGYSIWQKGFYDHIVRNETDFEDIYQYIQNNPQKWIDEIYKHHP